VWGEAGQGPLLQLWLLDMLVANLVWLLLGLRLQRSTFRTHTSSSHTMFAAITSNGVHAYIGVGARGCCRV
jgi:hypothetical protein